MRLWLVTPAWGRYDVSRMVFAQRAHLADTLSPRGIRACTLVIADDDNLDLAAEYGLHSLHAPNHPLGRKWNDGIEWACTHGEADFVAVVGSDDWVHPDLFDVLPRDEAPRREPSESEPVVVYRVTSEAISGRDIALVDLSTGRLRVCRDRGSHGVIPWVFPRVALEKSRFRPVADHAQRGLDGSLIAGLRTRPEWVFHDPHDLCRVDFKSDVNLNSYEAITGAIGYGDESCAWDRLSEQYPAELVNLARQTGERLDGVAA